VEYWWKENKAVAIPAGIMGLVALVWWWWPLSGMRAEASTVQRKRAMAEQQLRVKMAAGVPAEDAVTRATRDAERSKKQVAELKTDMHVRVPDGYKPSGGKKAGDYFVSYKEEVRKKINDKASTSGVAVPSDPLGFPSLQEGLSDELGDELLLRLWIVEKLSLAAIDSGVSKIDSVNAMVAVDSEPSETNVKKGLFVNRLTVRMRVIGPSKAVFEWLHRAQKKGEFLAVDDFKAEKMSPHEDIFGAELEVSGLLVDTAGALSLDKERP